MEENRGAGGLNCSSASAVLGRWGFDLTPYYGLMVSYVVIQLAPLLVAILGAFLLLEIREDGTVKALLVPPHPLTTYLFVLSGAMVVASFGLILFEGRIINLALPSWPAFLAASLVGSLAAPGFSFLVASLASNKTEAFAYLKAIGVAPLLLSGIYFVSERKQWLAALYPPYWAVKAYWVAEAGDPTWPGWCLGGLVLAVLWVGLPLRMFLRASRR